MTYSHRYVLPTLTLVVLLGSPSASLLAQEAASDAQSPEVIILDEVTVEESADRLETTSASTATKVATPRRLTPISISSVTSTALKEQDARILGDALENAAGVTVHRNGGTSDLFYIRGFESLNSSVVLTDGALEPEASLYRTYNVERVEVIRGPLGFLYGGNPLAGAVNLVRKGPAAGRRGSVSLFGGSNDTGYATFDYNHGDDDGRRAFRILGMLEDSAGYRDGRESNDWAINPSYRQRVGNDTILTFNAEVHRAELSPDSGLPLLNGAIPDVPRTNAYQTPFDFDDRDLLRLRFDIETRLGNGVRLHNKTYFTQLDESSAGTILNGAFAFGPVPPLVSRLQARLDDEQNVLGNQTDFHFDVETGGVRHQFVIGLEIQQHTDDFALGFFELPFIALDNPVESATGPGDPIFGIGFAGDTTTTIIAPYVLDTIHLGERWRLAFGGRFDSIDFEDDLTGFSRNDDQFSPFAGLLYAPNDDLSLYVSYGESFNPPSATVAASGREPEEGQQIEVGAKASLFDGRVDASFAVYRLEKDKVPIADNTGLLAQIGDQQSEGLEVELAGNAAGGTRWRFAYAYTDAELVRFTESVFNFQTFMFDVLDFSGNAPAWVPEHVADFWVSKRFDTGLSLAGGARYVSERFVDEDNVVEMDAYVTLDATIAYTRGGAWTARAHLKNLTDEDFEIRGLGAQSVTPADGFHFLAGLEFDF